MFYNLQLLHPQPTPLCPHPGVVTGGKVVGMEVRCREPIHTKRTASLKEDACSQSWEPAVKTEPLLHPMDRSLSYPLPTLKTGTQLLFAELQILSSSPLKKLRLLFWLTEPDFYCHPTSYLFPLPTPLSLKDAHTTFGFLVTCGGWLGRSAPWWLVTCGWEGQHHDLWILSALGVFFPGQNCF